MKRLVYLAGCAVGFTLPIDGYEHFWSALCAVWSGIANGVLTGWSNPAALSGLSDFCASIARGTGGGSAQFQFANAAQAPRERVRR